jgi:hypothetical protein
MKEKVSCSLNLSRGYLIKFLIRPGEEYFEVNHLKPLDI